MKSIAGYLKTANMTLDAFRVVYGKPSTPLEDREYRVKGNSAVGSVSEFIDHFGTQYGKIIFHDTSGSTIEQVWEKKNGKWTKTK